MCSLYLIRFLEKKSKRKVSKIVFDFEFSDELRRIRFNGGLNIRAYQYTIKNLQFKFEPFELNFSGRPLKNPKILDRNSEVFARNRIEFAEKVFHCYIYLKYDANMQF